LKENSTDKEIFNLLRWGNKEAFDLLYKRYWAELYKYAFYILRDEEVCKDIIQDIYTWIWENKDKLDIQTPSAYLKTAVKFKIANYIRSGNIRKSFFEDAARFDFSNSVPNEEELLELKELNHIIENTVANLPEKCKEIFNLSRVGNLSNREIASQLGISVKTVENQITIALKRIRSKLSLHLLAYL